MGRPIRHASANYRPRYRHCRFRRWLLLDVQKNLAAKFKLSPFDEHTSSELTNASHLKPKLKSYCGSWGVSLIARLCNFPGFDCALECRLIMLVSHATVSSTKPGVTPDLVIGTCVLIAIAFVVFWLFGKDQLK